MTRAAAFTAELVRSSSRGLAGLACALLFERTANAQEQYGEDGFDSWRQTLAARLQALASALESGDQAIFTEDLHWFQGVSVTRGIPKSDVLLAVDCLNETVRSQLPEETGDAVAPYFASAIEKLNTSTELPPEFDAGSEASSLFDLALIGDLGGARHFLLDGIRAGRFTVQMAVTDIILPAAREAGRRWHLGQMGIAAEHVITATLRSALHSLTAVLPKPPPNGKAAFIAAVPGDAHDTGLIAFALLLEADGWRVALAGADTPTEEVDVTAAGYECDLIALSATLPSQRYALSSYLSRRDSEIPVMVGGAAVRGEKDAKAMGARGFAISLSRGVTVARKLVGLDATGA